MPYDYVDSLVMGKVT